MTEVSSHLCVVPFIQNILFARTAFVTMPSTNVIAFGSSRALYGWTLYVICRGAAPGELQGVLL